VPSEEQPKATTATMPSRPALSERMTLVISVSYGHAKERSPN
jgi:hypothetical protein